MTPRNYTRDALDRAVALQEHQCAYCTLPFGTVVSHKGETTQTPVGDHFVPFTTTGRTEEANLVAACQVCNSLKSSTLFESVEHARRHLLVTRMKRRIHTLFLPDTPLTLDADLWGQEFARWIAG